MSVDALIDRILARVPGKYSATTRFGAVFPDCGFADFLTRRLILFGTWEPSLTEFFSRRLRPGDIFVDIGANIGYHTLLASKLVGPDGRVLAYEASPTIFAALARNIEFNGATNVKAANIAVGSQRGIVHTYLAPKGNRGLTTLNPRHGFVREEESVAMGPIDELLAGEDLKRVRLIKIDVEGNESAVLAPLAGMIDRLSPEAEIALELWPDCASAVEPFQRAGFNLYLVENRYDLGLYWRRRIEAPRRMTGVAQGKCDVILSRTESERL